MGCAVDGEVGSLHTGSVCTPSSELVFLEVCVGGLGQVDSGVWSCIYSRMYTLVCVRNYDNNIVVVKNDIVTDKVCM